MAARLAAASATVDPLAAAAFAAFIVEARGFDSVVALQMASESTAAATATFARDEDGPPPNVVPLSAAKLCTSKAISSESFSSMC